MATKLAFEDYYAWHQTTLGEDLRSEEVKKRYSVNLTLAQAGVNEHPFIKECANLINSLAADRIFALSSGSKAPDFAFTTKPYESVVDKTFRLNCNWNRVFPKEPAQGWTKSENWFISLDDLIRTSLVCRYLDGPERVCEAIANKAQDFGLITEFGPRATDEGYYAFHCYVKIPVDLMVGRAGAIAWVDGAARSFHTSSRAARRSATATPSSAISSPKVSTSMSGLSFSRTPASFNISTRPPT
jgi:hypothetical protein